MMANPNLPALAPRVVIATRNPGKLKEFRTLLAPAGWQVIGLSEAAVEKKDVPETGSSFAENARLKALGYSMDTGLPVIGDDSGLEVFALGGKPGVRSARYAGPDASDSNRVRKLLLELERHPGNREARFVCALAMAQCGKILCETEGECRGEIATDPRGTQGFGYDPVFVVPESGRTFAEMAEQEKNRCSHRARAVAALLRELGGQ
jgi:XTP/dITP diphosphohydrolase